MKLRTGQIERQTVRGTAKKIFFVVATDNIFSHQNEITYRSNRATDSTGNSKKIFFSSWQLTTFFHSKLKLRTGQIERRQTGEQQKNFFVPQTV